jgi:hypothetical protein
MIFDFFKVLFKNKQGSPKEPAQEDTLETPDAVQLVNMNVPEQTNEPPKVTPAKVIRESQKPPSVKNIPPSNLKKDAIINNIPHKEPSMSEIFLVVLDATGRTNFKALTQNIQNFYFVYATDEARAKEMVLYSFLRSQRRPADQLINEIQAALKATRMSAILRNMNEQNNFWTYVPFGRKPGAGQQIVAPDPSRMVHHTDPNMPDATSARAYVPAAPASGVEVTPDDLRGVQFSAQDGAVLNKLKATANGGKVPMPLTEDAPPLNPENEEVVRQVKEQNNQLLEANKQMMAKMEAMITAMSQPKKRGRKPADETQPPQEG